MGISCNERVLGVALIAFNVLFGILSLALISLGIVYLKQHSEVHFTVYGLALNYKQLSTMLIVLGCLSFLGAIIGCYFVRNYSSRLLKGFIIFLLILLFVELGVCIMAFYNVNTTDESNIAKQMGDLIAVEGDEMFHSFEDKYFCCGVNGTEDYSSGRLIMSEGSLCARNIKSVEGCSTFIYKTLVNFTFLLGSFLVMYTVFQVIQLICLLLVFFSTAR